MTLPSLPLLKILRDTSASQSLILADTLPFSEKTYYVTSVLIQGVECGFINVPLHNIYLSSDLVTGLVAVGIRPSLPFKGVYLLLGNDFAGDKVQVDQLFISTPSVDQPPDPIEQEIPDRYPFCAVTRAMAKKANQKNGMQDINLAHTFIGQSFNDEISKSLSPASLTFRLTLTHQGQTLTFHLQFQMTKVLTNCQGDSFVRNNTVILRYHLYLKELYKKMKCHKSLFAIMSKMAF